MQEKERKKERVAMSWLNDVIQGDSVELWAAVIGLSLALLISLFALVVTFRKMRASEELVSRLNVLNLEKTFSKKE